MKHVTHCVCVCVYKHSHQSTQLKMGTWHLLLECKFTGCSRISASGTGGTSGAHTSSWENQSAPLRVISLAPGTGSQCLLSAPVACMALPDERDRFNRQQYNLHFFWPMCVYVCVQVSQNDDFPHTVAIILFIPLRRGQPIQKGVYNASEYTI